jgi:hypothetical protein
MNKSRIVLVLILALALAAALAWFLWRQAEPPAPPVAPAPLPVTRPAEPIAAAPLPPAPVEPVIQHPVQAIETTPAKESKPLPKLDASDPRLKEELGTWLGRKKVQQFLQLDAFVRRVVVTVDNLGREHAAPAMWPVLVTPGRFTTLRQGETEIISPDNAQRYNALVQFIEVVDARQGVQLYVSLYPLFQQAYEELGYPKGYFNDRLVAVIDKLLATPVIERPIEVSLVDVKGPIPSERPWVRYEFADDDLQSLAAGQKMLLRTGPVNHRRLRAKLLEIRRLVTRAELPAAAARVK